MHKRVSVETHDTAQPLTEPLGNGKIESAQPTVPGKGRTDKITYQLSALTVEIRPQGWFVARTVPILGRENPNWSGPFETIECACFSISQHLAVEISARHTRAMEVLEVKQDSPLYGFKLTRSQAR